MRKRNATRGIEWTDAEIALVGKVYPSGGTNAVMALLPHRTRSQIKNFAQRWGITTSATAADVLRREDFTGVPVHDYTPADEVVKAWAAPEWAREQPMRWRVAA